MAKLRKTKSLIATSQTKITQREQINNKNNLKINTRLRTNITESKPITVSTSVVFKETPASLQALYTIHKEANSVSTRSSSLAMQALSPISKVKKFCIKLRRLRGIQVYDRPTVLSNQTNNAHINEGVDQSSIASSTTLRKCFVRLKRYNSKNKVESCNNIAFSPKIDDSKKNSQKRTTKNPIQSSNTENSENISTTTKQINRNNLRRAEKQNCNINLQISTPSSGSSFIHRRPFKELNLQLELHNAEQKGRQSIMAREKRGNTILSLTKAANRGAVKSKNYFHKDNPRNDDTNECESNSKKSQADNRQINCSKNLANNLDLIEELLLSDHADVAKNVSTEPIEPNSESPPMLANNAKKFFHRSVEKDIKNNVVKTSSPVKQILNKSNKQGTLKRRKESRGNIYDFLSQSQTNGSDDAGKCDPAADIIKKLIQDGKVSVATHKKGTGKLTLKRKNVSKKRAIKRQIGKKPTIKVSEMEANVAEDLELNGLNNNEPPAEATKSLESKTKSACDSSITFGTFSNLARSVLVSQAEKQTPRRRVTDQRILLEAARKFVSTPVHKKLPALEKTENMSPILPQHYIDEPPARPSPWRADADGQLPNAFYFSRNSANLPSFSSDFIPSSPTKKSANTSQRYVCTDMLEQKDVCFAASDGSFRNNEAESSVLCPAIVTNKQLSSLSSFSSNDSNTENIPPAACDTQDHATATNDEAINKRQQLNPLRSFNNRNPLKAINILEVISLPPLDLVKKSNDNYKNSKENNSRSSLSNQQQNKTISDVSNAFGFVEYIDDEEDSQQVEIEEIAEDQSSDLQHKLQQLRSLRPKNFTIKPISNTKPIRAVFDDDGGGGNGKQLNIKEMLCSTMINPVKDNPDRIDGEKRMENDLFEEHEPSTTFNAKETRRTYVRPYKRQRKLRHNFVMFKDSDESGEEENHAEENKICRPRKKCTKKEKQNPEFDSFVKNFNELCKEVDEYELVVE